MPLLGREPHQSSEDSLNATEDSSPKVTARVMALFILPCAALSGTYGLPNNLIPITGGGEFAIKNSVGVYRGRRKPTYTSLHETSVVHIGETVQTAEGNEPKGVIKILCNCLRDMRKDLPSFLLLPVVFCFACGEYLFQLHEISGERHYTAHAEATGCIFGQGRE